MFYTFNQNNSGGSFSGVEYIIIEARSADEANAIAESRTPIYFDGCDSGRDCSCCGDRWYPVSDYEGTDEPEIYGMSVAGTADEIAAREYEKFQGHTSYYGFDCDIYYAAMGAPTELRFKDEHYTAAKAQVEAEAETRWGFRYYNQWDTPTKVYQVFSAHAIQPWGTRTTVEWYASNGNDSLEIQEKPGWHSSDVDVLGGNMLYFTAEDKETAQAARKQFVALLAKQKKAARKAVSEVTSTVGDLEVPAKFLLHKRWGVKE